MSKSYDEKREGFQRMLGTRLPKAVKAVELLANLSRKSDYAWTGTELQQMVDALDDAVDSVMSAFGIEETTDGNDHDNRGDVDPAVSADGAAGGHDGDLVEGRGDGALGGGAGTARRGVDGVGPAVTSFDKAAIKTAYLQIAKGDRVHGMKQLRAVILGWTHMTEDDQ